MERKLIYCLLFTLICRIVPHIPNISPLLSFALLCGATLDRKLAIIYCLTACLGSDILLMLTRGYTPGNWTLFTYTGWLGVTLLPSAKSSNCYLMTLWAGLGFWIWTNFGTWLLSPMYPHTLNGLATCYGLGLPFLRNELAGDLLFTFIFMKNYMKDYLVFRPKTA